MAQDPKIESRGSIGSIILAILEVQVLIGPVWGVSENKELPIRLSNLSAFLKSRQKKQSGCFFVSGARLLLNSAASAFEIERGIYDIGFQKRSATRNSFRPPSSTREQSRRLENRDKEDPSDSGRDFLEILMDYIIMINCRSFLSSEMI